MTRLSLLDRSRTRMGEEHAAALRATVQRAQRAERLGVHRFWVAEHHGVPGIASPSPAVLAAAVAAATERIRVGSGGVMLPNHRPIVVAEQFAVLEALYPGRIDLGLGRSLGFTAPVREALGVTTAEPADFAHDVAAVRDFLTGQGPVTAPPVLASPPPLFVLATGEGVEVAARAGLPVVVGGPALTDGSALDRYRREFRPSEAWPEPYVVISLEVMVARTTTRARDLLLPEAWALAESRTTGAFPPLEPVEAVLGREPTPRQRRTIAGFLSSALYGTPTAVQVALQALVERTGADEVMATTSTYDRDELTRADAALTEVVGAAPG